MSVGLSKCENLPVCVWHVGSSRGLQQSNTFFDHQRQVNVPYLSTDLLSLHSPGGRLSSPSSWMTPNPGFRCQSFHAQAQVTCRPSLPWRQWHKLSSTLPSSVYLSWLLTLVIAYFSCLMDFILSMRVLSVSSDWISWGTSSSVGFSTICSIIKAVFLSQLIKKKKTDIIWILVHVSASDRSFCVQKV